MSTDLTDRTDLTGLDATTTTVADQQASSRRAEDLRERCTAAVSLPGDAEYDAARAAWNAAIDQRPAAVAVPTDAAQVAEIVRAAAAVGLRVAPQGTGHNAGPLGALDDVVLLRTSAMRRVWIDPVAPRARVEAGALWLDVVDAAAHYGLAALHGSAPDVGVVGYTLGGGMGWLARAHGLAAHHLISADLVLADGSTVHVDATHEPELFWALRGGGGNVGVVVGLEFDLFRVRDAYAGMLVWDWSRAAEVLERWVAWTGDAPDAVTTSFRILQLPPLPELPAPIRGRQLVVIDGAVVGTDDATASDLIAGLRDLLPEIDTFTRVPAASLVRLHMDPEGPTPFVSSSAVVRELPSAGQDALLAATGPGSGSGLFMVELRQLGGALARPAAGGGVLDRLDGDFVLFAGTVAMTPEIGAAGRRESNELVAGMGPWLNGREYLNFAESQVETSAGFTPEAHARLVRARATADPAAILRPNHQA